jgi:predicted nucleotidyltransferase
MNRSGKKQRRLGERVLLVLTGADRPLALREIAQAAGIYDSSARYALTRLIERALVRHVDERYSLAMSGQLLDFEVQHAVRVLGVVDAMRLFAAPNGSVAFASLRRDGASADVVLTQVVEPTEVLRLRELTKRYLGLELQEHEYRELQGTTVEDQAALERLRQRIAEGQLVKGDLVRLPRAGVRGNFTSARPLHRQNPRLPRLSRRTLQRLARRYGFAGLSLFGSAVRGDFRPDSDVDVLVRYQPGTRRTIASSTGLRDELSARLGHRVDLVDERSIDPELRANIARDIVRLYGRSRARSLASRTSEEERTGRDRRPRAAREKLGR